MFDWRLVSNAPTYIVQWRRRCFLHFCKLKLTLDLHTERASSRVTGGAPLRRAGCLHAVPYTQTCGAHAVEPTHTGYCTGWRPSRSKRPTTLMTTCFMIGQQNSFESTASLENVTNISLWFLLLNEVFFANVKSSKVRCEPRWHRCTAQGGMVGVPSPTYLAVLFQQLTLCLFQLLQLGIQLRSGDREWKVSELVRRAPRADVCTQTGHYPNSQHCWHTHTHEHNKQIHIHRLYMHVPHLPHKAFVSQYTVKLRN